MPPTLTTEQFEARFWERVNKEGPIRRPDLGPCWIWLGYPNPRTGYGSIHRGGLTVYVHRVAYAASGDPIPDGFDIDHLCRTCLCVRRSHLEAVPPKVNKLRGNGACALNARKTHCKRGHPLPDKDPDGFRRCRPCRTASWRTYNAKRRGKVAA